MPTLVWATDPKDEMVIDDVSGGLATSVPSHKLEKSFSPNLRNVYIDNDQIEQIKGFSVAGSSMTLQKITGIFPYYLENGQTQFLVTDSSIVIETSDFNSYVFVSSGHNTSTLMRCKQIENKMWCSNGIDSVFTWDHSVKTILDGTLGTPNVPKGKYIEYYQDRVWMGNLPSDASSVRFSDVRSTNGVIISPDNFLAWPAGNLLYVGRGDGQIINSQWLENGQLKFGKERSIYTLFGTNAGSYLPRITNPSVGVASHDSVTQMDKQSLFVGHDGIYRAENRVSDLIERESDAIDRSGIKTISNLWESQADFSKGQFQGSTASADGILYIYSNSTGTEPTGSGFLNSPPAPGGHDLTNAATFYGPILVDFGARISSSAILYTTAVVVNCGDIAGSGASLKMIIENQITGENVSVTRTIPFVAGGGDLAGFGFETSSQAPVFRGYEINRGSYSIKWEFADKDTNLTSIIRFPESTSFFKKVKYFFVQASTGQYISDVGTITTLNAWGNYDSLYNTNGGNIAHYIRTSTSVVNIATQTWQSIVPGVRINAPLINKYVQWAATLSQVSNQTPSIDNVEIVHIEGAGAVNRAFGIPWKGRYWLSFSTSADTVSSSILIKSKITNKNPDAWMPVSGINIRSFAKDKENTLYGGSSSTGIIYILDTGNNFNGSPIESVYETPSTSFGDLIHEKEVQKYYITAEKGTGSNFSLGVAIGTSAFTNTTVSLDGSGLTNREINNVSGKGKLFRWRLLHSKYDDPFIFHNFAVTYMPTRVTKGKYE